MINQANVLVKKLQVALAICVFFVTGSASAALMNFTGNLSSYTDYTITEFSLSSAGSVDAWTDSFNNGANFDPIVAFWNTDGSFIVQNDDNSSYSSLQTYWDSGLTHAFDAGTYYFTVSVFSSFATGSNLFGGNPFQAGCNGCTSGSGMGYSLWIRGVDNATTTTGEVPEPASLVLIALGLVGLVFARKKSNAA